MSLQHKQVPNNHGEGPDSYTGTHIRTNIELNKLKQVSRSNATNIVDST
jgi:hypothetical protein